jgi:hypothetical protein
MNLLFLNSQYTYKEDQQRRHSIEQMRIGNTNGLSLTFSHISLLFETSVAHSKFAKLCQVLWLGPVFKADLAVITWEIGWGSI